MLKKIINYFKTGTQHNMSSCSSRPNTQPKLIAVASGKGGVGKSTVTVNMATELANQGFKIGILDADIYGPSQANLLGEQSSASEITDIGKITPVQHSSGCYFVSISTLLDGDGPVIWRAPMATRMITDLLNRVNWPALDYLLIDLPPGTGDIQITLAQQAKLTGAIIVTTPQKLACDIAEKAIQLFEKVHVPVLGLVENMSGFVCGSCHSHNEVFASQGGQRLADKHQLELLSKIPLDSELVSLSEEGKTLSHASDANPARMAYQTLANNTLAALDKLPASVHQIDYSLSESKTEITFNNLLEGPVTFSAYNCRISCPCASCIDETSGQPLLDTATVPLDIQIEGIATVGAYGLKLIFSGGHNTGIFTFDYLKAMAKMQQESTASSFEV